VKFDNGPHISIHIELQDGEILSSRLSLCDAFTCTGATPHLLEWLTLYSQGQSTPLPFHTGTPFQRKVMQAMSQIPFGQTVSYKELAEQCDTPRGARAIGNACNRNPFPLLVPCHRVIHSDGRIDGFALDIEIKKRLLEFEAGFACPG
jgi:methylated-DNA-[protein]-cysteine S-methyltransferase